MNFIALFFLCVRMFHFIHSRRIAYLLQRFSRIIDERRANPGRKQVIIIDGSATTFMLIRRYLIPGSRATGIFIRFPCISITGLWR